MSDIVTVLSSMHAKGIRVWSEGGKIYYRAAAGDIAEEDIDILRERKAEILGFLDKSLEAGAMTPPAEPPPGSKLVPLTYSQQMSWKWLKKIGMKYNTRYCANAMRLAGELNLDCLKAAFAELVRRHEVLRMQIVPAENGAMAQKIIEDRRCELEIVSIDKSLVSDVETEARRLIEELVNQHCNVTVDPLFAARLVKVDDNDHVLVVALDHIIADALSVGIALRDIWIMYLQGLRGLTLSLPKVPMQFADYAIWEQKTNEAWTTEHGTYWKKRLTGASRTRVVTGGKCTSRGPFKMLEAPVRFSKELTERLREWGQGERTTLVMTVLTAYVALVARWTETSDVTLAFASAGRNRSELNHTIGFFAFFLYLRIEMSPDDSFVSLLHRVTREYYTALKHQDFGRSWLSWPDAEYTKTIAFNWHGRMRTGDRPMTDVFGPGRATKSEAIRLRSFPFKKAMLDREWDNEQNNDIPTLDDEPCAMLSESLDGVSGGIFYREESIPTHTMESFTRSFQLIAEMGCRNPQIRVADLPCDKSVTPTSPTVRIGHG
jgi:hypothetical protein